LLPAPHSTSSLPSCGIRARTARNTAAPARRMSVSPGTPASSIAMRSNSRTWAAV